jgi:predicted metalloprotease with PDZ domain
LEAQAVPAADTLRMAIAAWRPGSYRLRDDHQKVVSVTALSEEGAPLEVRSENPLTWVIETRGARRFKTEWLLRPGADIANADHFELHGPATYPYLPDGLRVPCSAEFIVPEGWKVATGLDSEELADGRVRYHARDYDTLADCPVELGRFERHEIREGGALYEIILHGKRSWKVEPFLDAIRTIVASETELMGGAPFERYVFIFHLWKSMGSYGLEHLNSTTIYFSDAGWTRNWKGVANLIAHEFFHLWNVKRIRPDVLGPFDYSGPVRTRLLWWSEGVTSYYADLTLVRSGIWTESEFRADLQREILRYENNPLRGRMSVEDASWRVWDLPEPQRIDYYNKGLILGALLDLKIRQASGGRKTLDDVMTFLYRWFACDGSGPIGRGFTDEDLIRACSALSGTDFSDFFSHFVAGTEDLPYAELLETAGYEVQFKVRQAADWGIVWRNGKVSRIEIDGAGAKAGVRVGDELVALNSKRGTPSLLTSRLEELPASSKVEVTLKRGKEELNLDLESTERSFTSGTLELDPEAAKDAVRRRKEWLGIGK